MGSGIAQVAAAAGHQVILADAQSGATARAKANMIKALDREVEKSKITRTDADALLGRISFVEQPMADDAAVFLGCGLVIEAIVEDLAVKKALFAKLEKVVAPDA